MADYIRVRLIDRNKRCIKTEFKVPLPRTLVLPYGNLGDKVEFKYIFAVAYGGKHAMWEKSNGVQLAVYMEMPRENKE